MGIDLPLIWAVIIIFGVMMYVVMDGFDLGIGMLFPFVKGEQDRDVMMNTVAPVWDGNETWLVLGGAAIRLRGNADIGMIILTAMFTLITAPVVAHRVGQLAYREENIRNDLLTRDEMREMDDFSGGADRNA